VWKLTSFWGVVFVALRSVWLGTVESTLSPMKCRISLLREFFPSLLGSCFGPPRPLTLVYHSLPIPIPAFTALNSSSTLPTKPPPSSLVSFTPRQRLVGEPAKTAETSNFRNTIGSLKRLVGRSFADPEVQEIENKFINAELVDAGGSVGVKVS
jgi:hypothetical protein